MLELTDARLKDELVAFLKIFKDGRGELKYRTQISQLPAKGGKSIIVDYQDLLAYNTQMATDLIKYPEQYLGAFNDAAIETLDIENPEYADKKRKELRVRIRGLTERLHLRGITKEQLNMLISVAGMVTRTSELRPLAMRAAFRCTNNHLTFVDQSGPVMRPPVKCDTEGCGDSKSFELDEIKTEFIDFQLIRIQELPEELPAGQLPQSFEVHLMGDIVNSARPGDRIDLTGIVKVESEFSRISIRPRLFNSRIEGNFIEQMGKRPEEAEVSREEEERIRVLASSPVIFDKLVMSVAPAIYGHELEKEAVLLMMVGSPQKILPDGSTLRGDLNVLLIGDPGTAKSELLKYVARIAPRGLYTSGRGSTAAGLTAAVVKEKNGMMMLEAGATVLADLGIASIDEFDKLREEDRSALHEVMEQQTASVAKGGIIATLNARTSILAAANPEGGKYDSFKNVLENVPYLPVPLLTRFDLIFIIKDEPDPVGDVTVAKHILDMRAKSAFPIAPPIDFDLLKKYIVYAKKIDPELTEEARNRLSEFYVRLRRQSSSPDEITITPRWLEGLVRLSIARARLLLHPRVTEDDALHAINLMDRMLKTVAVDQKTKKVDFGVLYDRPISEKGLRDTAVEVFKKLSGETKQPVKDTDFYDEMAKTGKFSRDEAEKVFRDMYEHGMIYEVKPHYFKRT